MKQFNIIHKQYTKVRPSYPHEVYDIIAQALDIVPAGQAVDIACGSGQSIDGLKAIAVKITGIDIGEMLLEDAARRHPDVTFKQGSGEEPGLPSNFADLVTIATAFYWMDREHVVRSLADVLRPGGVLAIYKYDFPSLDGAAAAVVDRHLNERWDTYRSVRLNNYDANSTEIIANSRAFSAAKRSLVKNRLSMAVEQYVDFMASTSYVSKYLGEPHTPPDYLQQFARELEDVSEGKVMANFDIDVITSVRN